MLRAVHAERGGKEKDEKNEDRRDELIPFPINDRGDHIKGIIISVQTEQMKNAYDTENAKYREAFQKEERQNGQKVHDPIEGDQEAEPGLQGRQLIVELRRRVNSQRILHHEENKRGIFNGQKKRHKIRERVEGLQEKNRDVQEDCRDQTIVKSPARPVFLISDGDDLEYSLFQTLHRVLSSLLWHFMMPGERPPIRISPRFYFTYSGRSQGQKPYASICFVILGPWYHD